MSHSVALTWGAPTTGGSVAGYNVKRSTTTGGPYATIGTTTTALTFTDTSAAVQNEGAHLFYVISATGPGGESPNSNEFAATIPFSQPGTPQGLTGVVQ